MDANFNTDNLELAHWIAEPLDDSSSWDLFTVASLEDIKYIQPIIERCNINSKNKEGWTPLMCASFGGKTDDVAFLISHKANVHSIDTKGKNALMIAARRGFVSVVHKLIHAGSIIESRDHNDWTPLFHGIYSENLDVVQTLLMFGANPNACLIKSSYTPLLMAVACNLTSIVEVLLKSGANPNFTSISGLTAMQMARQRQSTDIIELLLMEPRTGTDNKLDNLLSFLGMGSYIQLFNDGAVDLPIFLSLNEEELKQCGVTKLGPRKKLMEAIRRWHSKTPMPSGIEGSYANRLSIELSELKEAYELKDQSLKKVVEENKQLRSALIESHNRSSEA